MKIELARLARLALMVLLSLYPVTAATEEATKKDLVVTSAGPLQISFIGHGSLMLAFGGKIIHIDPSSRVADYSLQPGADLILITHDHGDHFGLKALQEVKTSKTAVLLPAVCADRVPGGTVMANGDTRTELGIGIEAVPAYNLVHMRNSGQPFHPKGVGNGYVLTFGDTRIYVAGDTENIPEMKALQRIAVAFLPMNVPNTMTPEMVADAARAFRPAILYPYHYRQTDPTRLAALLRDTPEIRVLIRPM